MIRLTHQSRIFLSVAPADFRKGIDGFVALCKGSLRQNPRDGSVLVFINRSRTRVRALSYDGNGYWLMTKRLSKGRFTGWPRSDQPISSKSACELREILSGHWSAASQQTVQTSAKSVKVSSP